MGCRRFSEKLAEAALEPGAVRDAALAAHLTACAACRQEFEARRRLAQAVDIGLKAAVSESPSPAFAAGVRARLAEESAPRASWFSGWVPLTAGALAVVVLMAAWYARREGPRSLSDSPQNLTGNVVQQSGNQPVGASITPLPPSIPERSSHLPRRNTPTLVRVAVPREPGVIVPPGQRDAVLRFYAAVMSRRVDASWALEEMKPLEVAELKIPPLEVGTGETSSPESGDSKGLQF